MQPSSSTSNLTADNTGRAGSDLKWIPVEGVWRDAKVRTLLPLLVRDRLSNKRLVMCPLVDSSSLDDCTRNLEAEALKQPLPYFQALLDMQLLDEQLEHALAKVGYDVTNLTVLRLELPLVPRALLRIAQFLESSWEIDAAKEWYEKAAKYDVVAGTANYRLAVIRALHGDIDSAVRYITDNSIASLNAHVRREPESVIPEAFEKMPFALAVKAHEQLAAELVQKHAALDLAIEVYRRQRILQQQLCKQLGIPEDTIVLPFVWVAQIGHMSLFDWIAKLVRLGWKPWRHIKVLAPANFIVNRCYLEYFKDFIEFVSDPKEIARLEPVAEISGFSMGTPLDLPGAEFNFSNLWEGIVADAWDKFSGKPLIHLDPVQRRHGRRILAELGMPEDAWFVCVHAREPGYHGGSPLERGQGQRDFNIAHLMMTIDEIRNRGGWVVRVGDRTMKPLEPMDRVLDYPHSWAKSEWMDIFLAAECRLFIGGASGLIHLSDRFDVPTLVTNWCSFIPPCYHPKRLALVKLLWYEPEQRLLSFKEMFSPRFRYPCFGLDLMDLAGIQPIENTAEEIHEVSLEALDMMEGRYHLTPHDLHNRKLLQAAVLAGGMQGQVCSHIGRDFLRRHERLLYD